MSRCPGPKGDYQQCRCGCYGCRFSCGAHWTLLHRLRYGWSWPRR